MPEIIFTTADEQRISSAIAESSEASREMFDFARRTLSAEDVVEGRRIVEGALPQLARAMLMVEHLKARLVEMGVDSETLEVTSDGADIDFLNFITDAERERISVLSEPLDVAHGANFNRRFLELEGLPEDAILNRDILTGRATEHFDEAFAYANKQGPGSLYEIASHVSDVLSLHLLA